MSDDLKKIATSRLWAAKKWPYLTHALLGLVPKAVPDGTFEEMNSKGTIAVTPGLVLLFEPRAIRRWTVSQLGSVLMHEVHHVVRRHGHRCGARDVQRWNAACDLEINDDMTDTGFDLPDDGGLHPKKFDLPIGKTAEEYYVLLEKKSPPRGGAGSGGCGECCTKPKGPGDEGSGEARDPDERTEADVSAIMRATQGAMKEAKQRGTLPRSLDRFVDLDPAPPKVPWERRLLMAARRSVSTRAGSVLHRYDRPSRRQAGVGYGTGAAVMPRFVAPIPAVVFAMDTSGSMGDVEVGKGLKEVDGALKALGTSVTFVSCDARVHELERVDSVRKAAALVKGGGGTDFCPVFRAIKDRKIECDLLAFFTDGYGTAPKEPPPYKVLWILTPGGVRPAPWGEVIEI